MRPRRLVAGRLYGPPMRFIALLILRGGPVLVILLLSVVAFDVAGAREPAIDAYFSIAEKVAGYFTDQITDAVPGPTPKTTP